MIVGKYVVYADKNESSPRVALWVGVRPTHLDRIRLLKEQGSLTSVKNVCALGTFFCNEQTRKTRVKVLMCRDKSASEITDDTQRAAFFETAYKTLVLNAWQQEIKNDTPTDLFKRADVSAYLMKSAARY